MEEGCSIAQIAAKTGLKENTAYKYTRTLEREHLLGRKTNPLRFVLGPAVSELRVLDEERRLLTAAAKIMVRRQAELPQSSIVLLERDGTTTWQRLCVQYNRPGIVIQRREFVVPLYTKASSLLFLAYSHPEEAERMFRAHPFEAQGKVVWKNRIRLEAFLAETRRLGYCLPEVPDIDGAFFRVAAPVFSPGNEVLAAVGAIIPESEPAGFRPTLVRLCRRAAREITAALASGSQEPGTASQASRT
jgi:DNA-binding IclR family transcriptional regulator